MTKERCTIFKLDWSTISKVRKWNDDYVLLMRTSMRHLLSRSRSVNISRSRMIISASLHGQLSNDSWRRLSRISLVTNASLNTPQHRHNAATQTYEHHSRQLCYWAVTNNIHCKPTTAYYEYWCSYPAKTSERRKLQNLFLPTALACNHPCASVCPSVCFHSIFGTDWPWTFASE